ncbi:hypothetical protein, partial [Salmonella sp. s58953]|uniref:hypothetical protein n=1 Tax=Salmonella sp. s58953 TaxID=3159711 RepID=UPI0039803CEE
KAQVAAAGASVEGLLVKAKGISSELSWEKFSSQFSTAVEKATEKPKVQVATFRGRARARSLPAKKAMVKQTDRKLPSLRIREKQKPEAGVESKPEVRKIFGGLF